MSTGKLIKLVILGPPGSGKGTISSRIVRDFKLKYVACGDLLRHEIEAKTEYGLKAKKFIDQGSLVPDEITTALTLNELKSKHISNSWLLDGYPRTVKQAEALKEFTSLDKVINLIVPEKEILARLTGRLIHLPSGRIYNLAYNPPKIAGIDDVTGEKLVIRDDDKPETVMKRLAAYHKQSFPVLEFYRKINLLIEFQGTRSDVIYPNVKNYLQRLFDASN